MLGIKNIYKAKPLTSVAMLLQFSSSRIKHRDGFSSHKLLAVKTKMVNLFWILRFDENSRVKCLETENKTS